MIQATTTLTRTGLQIHLGISILNQIAVWGFELEINAHLSAG